MADEILALRLVMPSVGDMELIDQDGGTIDLLPIFYGKDSMGPHVQVVRGHKDSNGKLVVKNVDGRYKLELKDDGKLSLRKGQE